ncbi:MAG: hypothetical protein JXA33_19330 [Anaerolineae bacterium]|nr:hypothetical protein [Anaerolineae bacterium]
MADFITQSTETQLWIWFLFNSMIPPQRGKVLLKRWQDQALSLKDIVTQLPHRATALGLTPEEAAKFSDLATTQVANSPASSALRWDESLYPNGLRTLPLKLRPALLFYSGAVQLLQHPIAYLTPEPLSDTGQENITAAISLLLGEGLLPTVFFDSPQATLLLEEMHTTEGEVLLFTRQGLNMVQFTPYLTELLNAGRLLMLSPLAPEATHNPAWNPYLEQIAFTAATYCITSDINALPTSPQGNRPITLLLSDTVLPAAIPPGTHILEIPEEILTWIDTPISSDIAPLTSAPLPQPTAVLEAPPPTPEEILNTLEAGGRVPEILRKKLLNRT